MVSPERSEILSIISEIEDDKLRNGYYLTYLCATKPSEIFGKYALTLDDVVEYEDRVLFKIKSARRGGKIRPVLLPKNDVVEQIITHMKTDPDGFLLHKNVSTSKTYAMNKIKILFKEYTFPHVDYSIVLAHEQWSKYLKDVWKPENQANLNFPIKEKAFTLSSLQKFRHREILLDYEFNRVEFESFTMPCNDSDDDWLYEVGMIYYEKLPSC